VIYQAALINSVVAPLFRYISEAESASVRRFHGTAFAFSRFGHFMTAAHVLRAALADAEQNGGLIGAFPSSIQNGTSVSLATPVLEFDYAPGLHDVAIFRTQYCVNTWFRYQEQQIGFWQDVAAVGYPDSITHPNILTYEVQQRAHKGYIQRIVPAGRETSRNHPNSFELSFPITEGLSGSPLFIHAGSFEHLIGVCVGSHRSRIADMEVLEEHSANAINSTTKAYRIEEFGWAHDLRPLLEWKPTCLHGRTLNEALVDF
jgi:hypothetical protein